MKKITLLAFLIFNFSNAQTLVGTIIQGNGREHQGTGCSINSNGEYFAGAFVTDDNNVIPGTLKIYNRVGTSNNLQQSISGDESNERFGFSTSMNSNGDRIVVGSYRKSNGALTVAGQVKVYQRVGTNWTQLGSTILGTAAGDALGYSVAISSDGTTIAVASPNSDTNGTDSGKVQVYTYNSTSSTWVPKGAALLGEAAGDQFGFSVSLSQNGNVLAVGARNNDGGGTDAGHVRIFLFNNTNFVQRGVDINGLASGDKFGSSVSISDNGNIIAIGAPQTDNGNFTDAGAVFCYNWNGSTYIKRGQTIFSPINGNWFFGTSISISANGNTIAIGAPKYQEVSQGFIDIRGFGVCVKFNTTTSIWGQFGTTVAGPQNTDVELGTSVAISKDGNYVLYGAPNTMLRGHMALYDYTNASVLSSDSFAKLDLKMYPNPVKDTFKIEGDITIEKISIYNLLGQQVKTFSNSNSFNISSLQSGTYMVEITSEKGNAQTKIIKE